MRIISSTICVLALTVCWGISSYRTADIQDQRQQESAQQSQLEVPPNYQGNMPPLLSALGIFSDLTTMHAAQGVEGYAVKFPLWSDGTLKDRHVYIPAGRSVNLIEDGTFEYPDGMILTKTFTLDCGTNDVRIETRVIAKFDGEWEYAVYAWKDDLSDARLTSGQDVDTKNILQENGKPYVIPGRPACLQCHEGDDEAPIGFAYFQLTDAYITKLKTEGKLTIDAGVQASRHLVQGRNPLEHQALGYLAGNCAHCHQANRKDTLGVELELTPDVDIDTIVAHATSRFKTKDTSMLVKPGHPEHSAIYRTFTRSMLDGPDSARGMMPPLGNQLIDPKGKKLLEDWIESLANKKLETSSQR